MTNKLEEVFKELQESHVLVDREEYEKLVEKAKEAEIEEVKFNIGDFFVDKDGINKTVRAEPFLSTKGYHVESGRFYDKLFGYVVDARKVTDEEIKLFKRAEMYHKHGRKLDELRVDDFVRSGNDIYQITQTKGFVESIIDGKHELYLTLEEAQEAHKKIVGE